MKILWITNIPAPYRISFFNELGKYCQLTVLFEKKKSDERDDSWNIYNCNNFNCILLKGISTATDKSICLSVTKYLKLPWHSIICSNTSTPTGMLAIQYMKIHHIPYWIEGDGGFAKSGKGFKEMVKKHFISGATGYFSTSVAHDLYYKTYGANSKRIFRYPFTSISEKDIVDHLYTKEEKLKLRSELGMKEHKIIISVGQFIKRKGFDVLIKASRLLSDDYGIYFIGGQPTEEYLSMTEDKKNIHYIGFKTKEELQKYYLASDLFVLPTREDIWGLVINEAMACGLPIITTNKCIAGLELVKNEKNGYIVPVNAPKLTAQKIKECFLENNLATYGRNSIAKIQDYTFEKMAERHIEVLTYGKD